MASSTTTTSTRTSPHPCLPKLPRGLHGARHRFTRHLAPLLDHCTRKRNLTRAMRATMTPSVAEASATQDPMHVIIAGAGIGGLVLAVGLLKAGFRVTVLERDLTAIRGEGKYRGPIQLQSNALAALEALDEHVGQRILDEGCITGDRINGLCDGITGDWYVKFDTFHPAVGRGLPVTRVISRTRLQEILAERCCELGGPDAISNNANVVDFIDERDAAGHVTAILSDGRRVKGDLLVGADGIWSKVRSKLLGDSKPNYSNYTCYTGIADFTPGDIDTVGYRVFLGNGKYFVSSDVGGGKMQWYAFHKEPAGGSDPPGQRQERLMRIFGSWSDNVTDLIMATREDDILRRDIFDRPPTMTWYKGRVVLLGDSAHAMQPNLGQGGGMAIEDSFQMVQELRSSGSRSVAHILRQYQLRRMLRSSVVHGMAGMAAFMASTYKAYLGEGLGPLSRMTAWRIPHPGRVMGQVVMKASMPAVLGWVLGGNGSSLASAERVPRCMLRDRPSGFEPGQFDTLLRDDAALLRAAKAHWVLAPMAGTGAGAGKGVSCAGNGAGSGAGSGAAGQPWTRLGADGLVMGSGGDAGVRDPAAALRHAWVQSHEGDYLVTDLGSGQGTFLNDRRLVPNVPVRLQPGDLIRLGAAKDSPAFRVKLQHVSMADDVDRSAYGQETDRPLVGV
uniref:Zeaxanthin epoxidase, chloroplastic n=2 Tax=Auxenochlorella protothecoides TaxID=3075 RepID=A0A1D1ZXT2_AUXPR